MGDRSRRPTYRTSRTVFFPNDDSSASTETVSSRRSSIRHQKDEKHSKNKSKRSTQKERWLLTRKTWKYMTDAGRRLIPDNAQNRPEDLQKIEDNFQNVCRSENKFLIWRRKCSYPGAITLSSANSLSRRKRRTKYSIGGQVKSSSADEADDDFQQNSIMSRDDYQRQQMLNLLEKYLKLKEGEVDYQPTNSKFTKASILSTPATDQNNSLLLLMENLKIYSQSKRSAVIHESIINDDLLKNKKLLKKIYDELKQQQLERILRINSRQSINYPSRTTSFTNLFSRKNFNFSNKNPPTATTTASTIQRTYSFTTCNSNKIVPLIEIKASSQEKFFTNTGIQTEPIPLTHLHQLQEIYKKKLDEENEEQQQVEENHSRRKSSVDNEDISQSVSETIKRYLRMARKKSVNDDQANRFKRINYDRNLRNIKAKGETTKPGDDDGDMKGSQTNADWITQIFTDFKITQSESISPDEWKYQSPNNSSPSSPSIFTTSTHFLSNLWHSGGSGTGSCGSADKINTLDQNMMQKSKSSSNVGHLVSKKIWRSRSKSQARAPNTNSTLHKPEWTPQGNGVWSTDCGKCLKIADTPFYGLPCDIKTNLKKYSKRKFEQLGIPIEDVPVQVAKKRSHLLKKKALTTSLFDTVVKNKDERGRVFGLTLEQVLDYQLNLEGKKNGSSSRSSFTSFDLAGSTESLSLANSDSSKEKSLRIEEPIVPRIVSECVSYLESNIRTLGLFRVSAAKARVSKLKQKLDRGIIKSLYEVDEDIGPHDICAVLKDFLRELVDPVISAQLYTTIIRIMTEIRNRRLHTEAIRSAIFLLPPAHLDVLYTILNFLSKVASNCDDKEIDGEMVPGNRMNSNALATVIAPNILRPERTTFENVEESLTVINAVRYLIDHCDTLFMIPSDIVDDILNNLLDSEPLFVDVYLFSMASYEDFDSESSCPMSPKSFCGPSTANQPDCPTYSRNICLNENAAMGHNMSIKRLNKERDSIKSKHRENDAVESNRRLKKEFFGDVADTQTNKVRSSSIDSNSSSQSNLDGSRRMSSPLALSNAGIVTATLKIPANVQLQKVVGQPAHLGEDLHDIPFIEDQCDLHFERSSELDRSKLEKTQSTSQIHSEPKITPQISSIGGAVLRSKTADFERYTYNKKYKSGNGGATTNSIDGKPEKRKGPIYKRQELISSVQSNKK